ncbi:DUF5937 family protein [Amycolatopsis sp. NPDC058278]|uniref:ArsR/SmtB family transcription factor n=1 Tax=Amycolatopsis sp. NPDC058278 TaxID=3346417 RepID=UPI0036D87E13
MALRLVFERVDLQRVRLATAPDPLWEVVSSVALVHGPGYAKWRLRVRPDDSALDDIAFLRALVPPHGDFPDFLTPSPTTADLDDGCEAILRTTRSVLSADVAAAFADRPAPGWAKLLAAGDRGQVARVAASVRRGHRYLVAPEWDRVRHLVATDRAKRTEIVGTHGVEHLLTTLPGVTSWDGSTLVVRYPRDRAVRLRGRGLTLVPSYFTTGTPITLIDQELPPVLVYPVGAAAPHSVATGGLDRLITRTRAECLHVLLAPHSTSALAHRLGVSVGTASKQATVLRACGLITSTRDGAAVVHRTTDMGLALLRGPVG